MSKLLLPGSQIITIHRGQPKINISGIISLVIVQLGAQDVLLAGLTGENQGVESR